MTLDHQKTEPPPQPIVKIVQKAGKGAIQIGQVGRDVVVHLLTPKVTLIILTFLLLVAAGSWYLYNLSQKPAVMTGDFNIAIAEFGEVTDQGIVSSARATHISNLLFDFLDSEFKATDFGLNVQVTHNKIGIISEDREAKELATQINADIVIYGKIFVSADEASFSPRFYIADHPDTTELTGYHRLALPIRFNVLLLDGIDKLNSEMQSRATILLFFAEGLVYLSQENVEGALHYFNRAIDKSESYGPFDGQEVLYLFAAIADHLEKNFIEANQNLDRAIFINPEYARAYIARGNIYYDQAVKDSFNQDKLKKALDEYQKALMAQDQPDGAYIREKVNTSLGNIYVVLAQSTNDPEVFALAIEHYDQVTNQFELTGDSRIKEMAAVAYFGLGAAYERTGDLPQAIQSYEQSIVLTNDATLKTRAEQLLKNLK